MGNDGRFYSSLLLCHTFTDVRYYIGKTHFVLRGRFYNYKNLTV